MLFVAGAVVAAQSDTKSVAKKKCNNLICLFDPDGIEKTNGYNPFLGAIFVDALDERIAPIIMTTNLLYNFCYWKTHYSQVMQNLQVVKDAFIGRKDSTSYFFKKVMDTNLSGWDCYFHKRAGLVLLMPEQYSNAQHGFDLENLDKIKYVLPATVLRHIENHKPSYDTIIDDFKSMFIKESPLEMTWNIYIAGHGGPSKKIKVKKVDEQNIAQSIKKVEARIDAIKEEGFNEEELIKQEKKLAQLRDELKQARVQGLALQTKMPGYIAGLNNQDFMGLMAFFEQGIKTAYLHYETCFAGGFNQILVNQELALLNVNFIVSAAGVNESVVYYRENTMRFTSFFKKLEALICDAADIVGDQEAINLLMKDSIAEIIEGMTIKDFLDYNQPFVRIPSIGVFKALDVAQEVQLLTHSLARAHEAEGTLIDYTDKSIKTIFIYPSHVAVPLKIKDHVAIASPVPQSVTEINKPAIYIFENISYQDNLSSIIPNFVSFNTRYQRIIFVIKELHCLDGWYLKLDHGGNKPIVLNNVIIKIAPASSQHDSAPFMNVSIDVAFTYNGRDYAISERIDYLQYYLRDLFDAFEEEKIEPIVAQDMPALAEKLIGKVGIAKLEKENKEITLSSMVGYFEQIMNSLAQRKKSVTGAKNAVLLKKTKQLERVTSDAALKMQKAFITKTEILPGVAWVKRLERLQKSAQTMLDYVNKLVTSDQGNTELVACKERIEKVMQRLNTEHAVATKQLSLQEREVLKNEKSPGVLQRAAGAMQKVGEAIVHAKDTLVRQAKKAYSYVTGRKEEKEYRYGYGRPR